MMASTIALTSFPAIAFAQETTPTTTPKTSGARCTEVTNHINTLLTRLQNDESVRENRHQKVVDRLNALIPKLDAKNVDTSGLKTAVSALSDKKTTWQAAYTALLSKLEATKQYACGKSEGQFKQATLDARTQRKTMHAANVDFWSYVKNTVKPDLKTARNQTKNK